MPLVGIGSNFVLNLPLHLPAKKGMPLDALWIYEVFLRFWYMVCSLLLVVRVTMCCARGGVVGSTPSVPARCVLAITL